MTRKRQHGRVLLSWRAQRTINPQVMVIEANVGGKGWSLSAPEKEEFPGKCYSKLTT